MKYNYFDPVNPNSMSNPMAQQNIFGSPYVSANPMSNNLMQGVVPNNLSSPQMQPAQPGLGSMPMNNFDMGGMPMDKGGNSWMSNYLGGPNGGISNMLQSMGPSIGSLLGYFAGGQGGKNPYDAASNAAFPYLDYDKISKGFQTSPGYEWEKKELQRAIGNRSAAGGYSPGMHDKELLGAMHGLASREYNSYMDRAMQNAQLQAMMKAQLAGGSQNWQNQNKMGFGNMIGNLVGGLVDPLIGFLF